MHRIDSSTAVAQAPAPGPVGAQGYFTAGDPAAQVPATTLTPAWANDVQENILAPIVAVGIAPLKGDGTQLLKAIQKIASGEVTVGTASTVQAGTVELTTRADLVAGADASKASTSDAVAQAAQSGCWTYGRDTGPPNALAVALTPAPSLVAGMQLMVLVGATNTAASTLALNGGAAKSVRVQGAEVAAGQLEAGQLYALGFDGNIWELLSPPTVPAAAASNNASAATGPWWSWDDRTGIVEVWGQYAEAVTTEGPVTVNLPIRIGPVQWATSDAIAVSNVGDTTFPYVGADATTLTFRAQDSQGGNAASATGFFWRARSYSATLPAAA